MADPKHLESIAEEAAFRYKIGEATGNYKPFNRFVNHLRITEDYKRWNKQDHEIFQKAFKLKTRTEQETE